MSLRHTEIAPGVHRLFRRHANWYLLESGGRLTVLDAGLPGEWRAFSSALVTDEDFSPGFRTTSMT